MPQALELGVFSPLAPITRKRGRRVDRHLVLPAPDHLGIDPELPGYLGQLPACHELADRFHLELPTEPSARLPHGTLPVETCVRPNWVSTFSGEDQSLPRDCRLTGTRHRAR